MAFEKNMYFMSQNDCTELFTLKLVLKNKPSQVKNGLTKLIELLICSNFFRGQLYSNFVGCLEESNPQNWLGLWVIYFTKLFGLKNNPKSSWFLFLTQFRLLSIQLILKFCYKCTCNYYYFFIMST